MTFSNLGVDAALCDVLERMEILNPTPVQEKAIPILIEKKDVDIHAQAQTGTGKTLAFGIPLVQRINPSLNYVQALVVAPTRELVLQITEQLTPLARARGVNIQPIYGGVSMHEQIRVLARGVHIVVGTPGRLNDHLRRKTMNLNNLQVLVLDEADIMLDMGFKEEIDQILTYTPKDRRIWLFSATVKQGIHDIMQNHMRDTVSVRTSKQQVGTTHIVQYYAVVPLKDRFEALCRFIDTSVAFYGFIFCQTKILTAEVAEHLIRAGYRATALHGDMSQQERNRVIKQFKARKFTILVATDVAARGIDINDLTHVVNYSLPEDSEAYVHRVGRTGRAGKEGTAITFIAARQVRSIKQLEKKFSVTIKPIDVPSKDEITKVRIAQASEHLASLCHQQVPETKYTSQLKAIVTEYDHGELVNAVVALLSQTMNIKDESETYFAPTSSVESSSDHQDQSAEQEIVLFAGTDDGVTQDKIVHVVSKTQGWSPSDLYKVKVLKKRTFIRTEPERAQELIKILIGANMTPRRLRGTIIFDTGEEHQQRKSSSRSGGPRGRSRRQ